LCLKIVSIYSLPTLCPFIKVSGVQGFNRLKIKKVGI